MDSAVLQGVRSVGDAHGCYTFYSPYAPYQNCVVDSSVCHQRSPIGHRAVDSIDLLWKLRNVLRDDLDARRFYQAQFDHILVDELQDTDPLQAEIVLYLSEGTPRASRWQDVEVQPGKLTLVGDPKQSIYRFRRADVGMYERLRTQVGLSPLPGFRIATGSGQV